MRRYNRPLVEGKDTFSVVNNFYRNDFEFRILNGLPNCRFNEEKIRALTSDAIIHKEQIKKEFLFLQRYKSDYLCTYPCVDEDNPYAFTKGMINRCKSTMSTLFEYSMLLTPKYREKYNCLGKKKEIWNDSVLFAREFQLSMFTDEYPQFVIDFITVVVEIILLIREILEYCDQALQEEKATGDDVEQSRRLYLEAIDECFSDLQYLDAKTKSCEDIMAKILQENGNKGYGIGYHNRKVTKPIMMVHAVNLIRSEASSAGINPTTDEIQLFKGDIETIKNVRHILNNITPVKEKHKTLSNILAVLYLEYADNTKRNKNQFVKYANTFLEESERVKATSIYRPTKKIDRKSRNEIKSTFAEILENETLKQVS